MISVTPPENAEREKALTQTRDSVKHLQQLYTVVAGFALITAVTTLATKVQDGRPDLFTVLMLIAFVVTIIPFFHGASRHLDDFYLTSDQPIPTSRYALLVDFILLFSESVVLVGMAKRSANPSLFAEFFLLLLIVDLAWALLSLHFISNVGPVELAREIFSLRLKSDMTLVTWVKNDLLFGAGTILLILFLREVDWPATREAALIGVLALIRSAADYKVSWDFYFPPIPAAPIPPELI